MTRPAASSIGPMPAPTRPRRGQGRHRNATAAAFARLRRAVPAEEAGADPASQGNGSLMARAHRPRRPADDAAELIDRVHRSSAVTHGAPDAWPPARCTCSSPSALPMASVTAHPPWLPNRGCGDRLRPPTRSRPAAALELLAAIPSGEAGAGSWIRSGAPGTPSRATRPTGRPSWPASSRQGHRHDRRHRQRGGRRLLGTGGVVWRDPRDGFMGCATGQVEAPVNPS